MNPHLGDDAREFGEVAARAFADAGGVDLARRAELDPELRRREIGPLLGRLGADDLDARTDPGSAEAAAALCREAGRVVLPFPVVPVLSGDADAPPLALRPRSGEPTVSVDHADLFPSWRMATIGGETVLGSADGTRLGSRLGPFVGRVSVEEGSSVAPPAEIALHLTLSSFCIAGGMRSAIELATSHVVQRVQFDKPLSAFQAVQFQLADAHVAAAGVDEVAQFALWRCHTAPGEAIVDALAARSAALDAARAVLRTTQQLHGAAGVCDEYDVSVIVRHLQPVLRLPFGAETTAEHLAAAIDRVGFAGLYLHGAVVG